MLLLYVAAGGAFGAVCRYLVMQTVGWLIGRDFPYATLFVNVAGSFFLGLLIGWLATVHPRGRELYLLLGVGALGGFTTFSTFAYDSYLLIEKGLYLETVGYIASSVLLAIGAFVGGMWAFKAISA